MIISNLDIRLIVFAILLIASGTIMLIIGQGTAIVQEKEDIEYNLTRELSRIQRDMVPVLEAVESTSDFTFDELNSIGQYPFFIFRAGRLAYWSDYRYVPEYKSIRGNYRYKFINDVRKSYVVRRWEIADKALEVYAILPLYTGYKIENDYIKSSCNPSVFPIQNVMLGSINSAKGDLICLGEDNCLFKVVIADSSQPPLTSSPLNIWIILAGTVLLVIVLFRLSTWLSRRGQTYLGLAALIASLLALRGVMLSLSFPHSVTESTLFQSSYFASSDFNPSLGDLFINICCFCLVGFYLFYNKETFLTSVPTKPKVLTDWIMPVLFIGLGLLIFHFEFLIFQTLYHNSQLTFDINQSLGFDVGRIVGFSIILLFIASIFFVFHVLYMAVQASSLSQIAFLLRVLIAALLFSAVNFSIAQEFLASLIVGVTVLLLVHFTGLFKSVNKLKYRTFLYFFIFMIGGAALGSIAVYDFEKEASYKKKKRFANQLLIQNDNLAEFLLAEANSKIKNDRFIQSRMSSPFSSKEIVKTKIRQEYLSNYFDKYDIDIYLYNSSGQPFNNLPISLTPGQFDNFNSYATSYPDIYFINSPSAEASKRYLNRIEIKKRGLVVGYAIIDLNLKRIIPESVYPELLVDHRLLMPYQNNNYSYAIFRGNAIQYSSGDFNYQLDFQRSLFSEPELYESTIKSEEYWHTALRDVDSKTIVISSDDHPFTDVFSNFSFLFLLQVFLILIVSGFYFIYFALQPENLNYSAKIQLYLNLAFFMPLIAVSFTTLSLINSSFEKEVNQEYFKKAESISNNVSDDLNNYVSHVSVDPEELRSKLTEVTKYSGVDVNLFNIKGKLIASSQPQIFENDLLSDYINPEALSQIKEKCKNSYILQESVGSLKYNTTFFAVKSFQKGELIGIVSIPYFKSEYNLEQSQITVLTNVINVFTLVFIIFL
ncbi:MAG: hypothetical protein AAGG59_06575, partial [Bacteroidota bacterium]